MNTTLKLFFGFLTGIAILSCSDEPDSQVAPTPGKVTAQFAGSELSLSEGNDPVEVKILFDKPAIKNGVIAVTVATTDIKDFTTTPAIQNGRLELPVTKGQTFIKFVFSPTNNDLDEANSTVGFTIEGVSDGFIIGDGKVLSITLTDDESPAQVNFMLNQGSARENSAGSAVMVVFSHAVPGTGSVEISFSSAKAVYGTHFITNPEAVNGKIKLTVESGVNHVQFNVIPINDLSYNGDRAITYTISQVDGAIVKGEGTSFELLITDDELEGKNKGYTIIAGNWSYKTMYEYNERGLLSQISWEKNTPYHSEGTHVYYYNELDQVTKKVESSMNETIYTWQDGRIIRMEKYNDGVLKQYTLYGYDDAGNIGESSIHDLQPDGEFKLTLLFVYLYKLDGNIYKQLTYSPIEGSEEHSLVSTRTYDHYLSSENPFSMVEILPNSNTQPNLPGLYRLEENGYDILYQFSYEFDADGRPTKRIASSPSGSEVAYYEYY